MKTANQLIEKALPPLPLGSIRPGGWLLHQLRIQAEGLTGHLDEFWPDVAESGWIGGTAEGWERGPYWLAGFVPLAFLLDDENQYDQQVNQVICAGSEDPIYTTNGPDANIF